MLVTQGYDGDYSMYDDVDAETDESDSDNGFDTDDEPEGMSDRETSSDEE